LSTFILVPGAWLGAWAWSDVTAELRGGGHDVRPVTLTGLAERARVNGALLHRKLATLQTRFPQIGAVTGKGLVAGVICVRPGTRTPDGDLAFDIVRRTVEKGVLMFGPVGHGGATVKICPPLVIPPEAIEDSAAAHRSMEAAGTPYVFSGHVHDQMLYFRTPAGKTASFRPTPGSPVPMPRRRGWLAIIGSVGQPRDGNPESAYALFDGAAEVMTFFRIPYDHLATARRIRAGSLPEMLAERIVRGD